MVEASTEAIKGAVDAASETVLFVGLFNTTMNFLQGVMLVLFTTVLYNLNLQVKRISRFIGMDKEEE